MRRGGEQRNLKSDRDGHRRDGLAAPPKLVKQKARKEHSKIE
jgi:hypothetical protein